MSVVYNGAGAPRSAALKSHTDGGAMTNTNGSTPGGHYLGLEGVQVSLDSYMDDFKSHLLTAVRPAWLGRELDSKVFDTGITNKLVAIFLKEKGLKKSREDVVLLRINGVGTEKFISRSDEVVCMTSLHNARLCPPVYALLGNGLCYGYFPGDQVGVAQVREEGVSGKIARLLARLHCVEVPVEFEGREPQVWAKISQWSGNLPPQFSDAAKQKRFERCFGSLTSLKEEVRWLRDLISNTCHSPMVFCHNDPLIANFIYDSETEEVGLVDYEYGGPNYLAFDIADHFCEYAGAEVVDFDLYPDETFQKRWLRIYLEERARLTGLECAGVTDQQIHSLYKEVCKFALSAHLFWATCTLLQSIHSNIDFDCFEYAILRYSEERTNLVSRYNINHPSIFRP